ncbi:DUF4166 domain-containing protein [Pararoseomonas sp. SCSIO 73927]|uniref:DUF4166 domain-containing protein n=1 Tax=Pararoseomonas sp. SCSIO 73927 TaxID=3114537 RepID=UPI0030D372CA
MSIEAALAVLGIQGVLGAYDNIRNHEFREGLPHRSSQGSELVLHAAREGFYLVLFPTMAWLEWRGWCAWLLGAVILAEIGVTCRDFVEEDRTRRLSANERVLHTVLTLNYGAFLALFLPELVQWSVAPAGLAFVDRGIWSWLMTVYALGVLVFGIRELRAGLRMRRGAGSPIPAPPHLIALGPALPDALRRLHEGPGPRRATGSAVVRTGGSLSRLLLRCMGLGMADGRQSLCVVFEPDGGGELWHRDFGTGRFTSRIDVGVPGEGTIAERFGPFSFDIVLAPSSDSIAWTLRKSRLLGLPVPALLAPRVVAREWMEAGQYRMSVEIGLPGLGHLLSYAGTLERATMHQAP